MREVGGTAVVALMHPPKDCTGDNITVRGGGLGEIDEMLVGSRLRQAELFHRKWRGPGFDPVMFKLAKLNLPQQTTSGAGHHRRGRADQRRTHLDAGPRCEGAMGRMPWATWARLACRHPSPGHPSRRHGACA